MLYRLFSFTGPVGRRFYLKAGFGLMALKYIIDFIAIYAVTSILWTPVDYLIPLLHERSVKIDQFPLWFSVALVIWTLPFIWIGSGMTFRRAIDAGKSPWLVILFFIPVLNYLLMLWLCFLPSTGKDFSKKETSQTEEGDRFRSALLGVVAGMLIGTGIIVFNVIIISSYGLSVFVLVPFVLGLVAAYVYNARGKHSMGESLSVAFLSVLLLGGALILFALEGILCVAMAFPLALPIALFGSVFGHKIAVRSSSAMLGGFFCLLLLPAFWGADALNSRQQTFEVMTAIEIPAPPEEVWDHVIQFEEIKEVPAWYFRLGIAYPVRARIEGEGVEAVRYCEFSTGAFVEPITAWEEPYRLAFDVSEQPKSLNELSFYDNVNAPHVDNFFRSVRGVFKLVPLENGATRLEGRTWYRLDIYPHFYWRPISEWIVHNIHERVLNQIADQASRKAGSE